MLNSYLTQHRRNLISQSASCPTCPEVDKSIDKMRVDISINDYPIGHFADQIETITATLAETYSDIQSTNVGRNSCDQ